MISHLEQKQKRRKHAFMTKRNYLFNVVREKNIAHNLFMVMASHDVFLRHVTGVASPAQCYIMKCF